MMNSKILILVFPVILVINGQQYKSYDSILSEMSALKRYVFSLNAELDQMREQHNDMRNELRTLRGKLNLSSKNPFKRSDEYAKLQEQKLFQEKIIHRKRSAYVPSFHLPRNISRVTTGVKGEKGDSGMRGPKGNIGITGPPGQKGVKGSTGQTGNVGPMGLEGTKGNQGTTGAKGEKGDTGIRGPKGDMGIIGPKGQKGDIGTPGAAGPKGDPGPIGLVGPKGNQGTNKLVAFSARPFADISNIIEGRPLLFSYADLNLGGDYNQVTGYSECSVAGVYVFTWSVAVNDGHSLTTLLHKNGQPWGFQFAAGIKDYQKSGYSTTLVELSIGDQVYITAYSPPTSLNGTIVKYLTSSFSGFLLN